MKTWTNPTVEELEVKMTANGFWDDYVEEVFNVDLPILNDKLKEEQSQS